MVQMQNLVSAEVPAEKITALLAKVQEVRAELELINLTPDERRGLIKPGQKVLDALPVLVQAAQDNPQYFAKDAFDPEEMARDIALAKALTPLYDAVHALDQALADTILAAESDAYRNGLGGYTLLKVAIRFVPGLAALSERLRAVFDRKGRRTAAEAPTA